MNGEGLYQIAVITLLALVLPVSIHHRRKARQLTRQVSRRDEERSVILIRLLVGLPAWSAVLAYAIRPEWMAWSQLDLPAWLRWFGAAMASIMIPLTPWIFRNLGLNVSETVLAREDQSIVTTGPYRWIRHPLYSAATLYFAGLSLLMASWLLGLLTLAIIGALPALVRREESNLLARFGSEYADYMARTGRFLPGRSRRG